MRQRAATLLPLCLASALAARAGAATPAQVEAGRKVY